jgi:hypothetical protein
LGFNIADKEAKEAAREFIREIQDIADTKFIRQLLLLEKKGSLF